jgi:hypothetical protein
MTLAIAWPERIRPMSIYWVLLAIVGAASYIGACVNAAARNIVTVLSAIDNKIEALTEKADLIASKADEIEDCVSGDRQKRMDELMQRLGY